jgi:transcriptional regulator
MYTPPAFRITDEEAAFSLADRYGFATLITVDGDSPVVSHLPMICDPDSRVLRGRLARANPHSSLLNGRQCRVLFIGANAYVSPDWYGDAEQVPTWNYSAVNIDGIARVIDDPALVDALLEELSDRHERRRHDLVNGKIWKIDKLSGEKLFRLRAAIVAFELSIDRIEFKAKLSQNKRAEDFQSVMSELAAGDDMQRAVADAMRDVDRAMI